MLTILLCVAYAILYGLLGYLFILALKWLISRVPFFSPLPAEAMPVIQAIIAVLVFIMLLLCLFGEGPHAWDILHLHGHR